MKKGFEKRFTNGDIVYWCHRRGHEYSVHFGMVDEQWKYWKNKRWNNVEL